jgi:hypothetical protein
VCLGTNRRRWRRICSTYFYCTVGGGFVRHWCGSRSDAGMVSFDTIVGLF